MIKLSYIKSDDRQYNVERCLSLIKTEITKGLKEARSVVIKPNCITDKNQLACTHVDALAQVLEFIRPHMKGQITLAEGCTFGNTLNAFKEYDYYSLQDQFDLAIVDLNSDDFETIQLLDDQNNFIKTRISETLLKSDYIISLSPPKTDRLLGFAGVIYNVASVSLQKEDNMVLPFIKKKYRNILFSKNNAAENIKSISQYLNIKLAIVDAFEIMEGDGPVNGQLAAGHFCIAGTNPLAVDTLTCTNLGIEYSTVGYLQKMNPVNPDNYFVIGDDWKKKIMKIKTSECST